MNRTIPCKKIELTFKSEKLLLRRGICYVTFSSKPCILHNETCKPKAGLPLQLSVGEFQRAHMHACVREPSIRVRERTRRCNLTGGAVASSAASRWCLWPNRYHRRAETREILDTRSTRPQGLGINVFRKAKRFLSRSAFYGNMRSLARLTERQEVTPPCPSNVERRQTE